MAIHPFRIVLLLGIVCVLGAGPGLAGDMEVLGVKFPGERVLAGKTLKLSGVSYRKAMGLIKVYAGGFYLENPSQDPEEVIASEQVKYFHLHYMTEKATAKKLQEGFIEAMEKCNPPELVEKHRDLIALHASWMDKDMADGKTSETLYEPGKGLTVIYQGEVKGTIPDEAYAQMYFRYTFGDKADARMRSEYLGIK